MHGGMNSFRVYYNIQYIFVQYNLWSKGYYRSGFWKKLFHNKNHFSIKSINLLLRIEDKKS